MGRILDISILMIIGVVCIMSIVTFVADLSINYDVSMPANISIVANSTISKLNKTSSDLIETVTKGGAWYNTLYDIFFKLPVESITTMTSMISLSFSFITGITEESNGIIPIWVLPVVVVVVSLFIAFTVIAIALKWNV